MKLLVNMQIKRLLKFKKENRMIDLKNTWVWNDDTELSGLFISQLLSDGFKAASMHTMGHDKLYIEFDGAFLGSIRLAWPTLVIIIHPDQLTSSFHPSLSRGSV